ncbi:MAG: hypothetical protein II951_05340 [Bacteroidales bacterium]|nr:hypothetical protein [Bacteroidales bacterium]
MSNDESKGKITTIKVRFSERELLAIDKYVLRHKSRSREEVIHECAVRFVVADMYEEDSRLFPVDQVKLMSVKKNEHSDMPSLFDYLEDNPDD